MSLESEASCQCLGIKIQAFSESEYGLNAVSEFGLSVYSGLRLILNPEPDFFLVVPVPKIFADPNFSDQKVKQILSLKNILI